MNPILDIERAAGALQHAAIGHTLDYHAATESTMIVARRLAERPDIPSGTIVVAEEQSAGRGRLRRTWESPAGRALLLSIILRRGQLPSQPGHLAMLAGLATAHALDPLVANVAQVGLKWPNDVVVSPNVADDRDPPPRKVAGILIESVLVADRLDFAIVGIGINVNQMPAELPHVAPPALAPASLFSLLGRTTDRTDLLIALALRFAEVLRQPEPMLAAAWKRRLWTLGKSVTVYQRDGSAWSGRAVDVDANGALLVDDGSQVRAVEAGDVSLRNSGQTDRT